MGSDYRFKLKRRLTESEIEKIWAESRPKISALVARYGDNLPIEDRCTTDPKVLDFIRTKWFLDDSLEKPAASDVTEALWPAFGKLLEHNLGMVWCEIEDNFGVSLSMLYFSTEPTEVYQSISVPPLSYVQKRESIPNAEVFADAVRQIGERLRVHGS